jgi:hypothetical protein
MKLKPLLFIGIALVTVCSALALAADEKVPDKVVMKYLENLYEPSVFDHKLHTDVGDSCKTCHHKPEGKHVKCIDCHKVPFDKDNLGVIGLKAALHEQCMGCHEKTGAKNDCLVCHATK